MRAVSAVMKCDEAKKWLEKNSHLKDLRGTCAYSDVEKIDEKDFSSSATRYLFDCPNGYYRFSWEAEEKPVTTDRKVDAGKPDLTKIPYAALTIIADIMAHGEGIYGERNYLNRRTGETKAQHIRRYAAAGLRHWFKSLTTEIDPDSGKLHIGHAACNAIMALDIWAST